MHGSPLDHNVTLNAVEKFTFSELQVLLMFEFTCTLKLKFQSSIICDCERELSNREKDFHRTKLK